MAKINKFVALTLLIALLGMAAAIVNVQAQSQGSITVMDSVGGSTNPAAGTSNYDAGTNVDLTATADTGYIFQNWIVSTTSGSSTATDNPLTLPVTAGTSYTVQAIFAPIQLAPGFNALPSDLSTAAIVVVLPAAGGTTNPPPGTYALANATSLNLQATPDSGWQFSHWVISGVMTSHGSSPVNLEPTDNPYNVNHGYGATYNYQPVFTQTGTSPGPSPSIPEFSGVIVGILAIALLTITLGTVAYKRRK